MMRIIINCYYITKSMFFKSNTEIGKALMNLMMVKNEETVKIRKEKVKYAKIKDVEYVLSDEYTRYYFQITIGLEQKHI